MSGKCVNCGMQLYSGNGINCRGGVVCTMACGYEWYDKHPKWSLEPKAKRGRDKDKR